jgi:hypothetical protein
MKKLGGIAVPALAAAILAGCGSGPQATSSVQRAAVASPQSPIVQGKLATEAREAAAKEERERKAEERHEAHEAAKERREQEQQEAHERAEREAEENAPDSHHYPPSVRVGFLHGCESTSGHEDAACECAIKRIEAKVPLGRYRQNEAEVRVGKPPAFIYNFEYGYCEGSEAASG